MRPILEPLSSATTERSNWDVLSLLRFFLALIVALDHLIAYSGRSNPFLGLSSLGSFEAILGFLLISGYSIGSSIKREPTGFLRRRMLRIYPVYLAAMLVTYFVQREAFTPGFMLTLLLNLVFLGQVVMRYSYVGASWSLGLEVWLYCLAPLFLRLRTRALEWLIAISFFCYCFYTCGRTLFHWPHYAGTLYGINLPCLAFIWIAGFCLATSTQSKLRPLKIVGLLFLGHLLLALGIQVIYRLKHNDLHGFIFADLADFIFHGLLLLLIGLVFVGVIFHRFQVSLFARHIFRFLGDISYPLYLVHLPTFGYLSFYTHNSLLLLIAALVLSSAVYYACDFYSRRRKLA